ncbi:DUF1028 domain-containing protein [bacterium]|nr:DUF1028 domain-containing protein [bacterium]
MRTGNSICAALAAVTLALLVTWCGATEPVATFSIVAFDEATGELGVAVQSKFFAVGSVVPWARAGVGAIASQAFGNTTFGPRGLDLIEEGLSLEEILDHLLTDDEKREQRQIGIVDASGNSIAFTGDECMDWAGHRSGRNYSVQGNILVSENTVDAMASAFEETEGLLGERLMRAIEAGQEAGGDSRGMQSAAILIVSEGGGYGGYNDRYCDLRVDDHENPIAELRRIFNIWKEVALITEGYRLLDEGDHDKAIALGRRAVEQYPESAECRYHLACYLSRGGMHDEAMRELEKAVAGDAELGPRAKLDPDFEPLKNDPGFHLITDARSSP